MQLSEFIESLDLPCEFKNVSEIKAVAKLKTDDEFVELLDMIIKKDVKLKDCAVKENTSRFTYSDGYFDVSAIANYEDDIYLVEIEEV